MSSTLQVRYFYSIIKHSVPSTYIPPQGYYNRHQICTVLMHMVQIFWVITVEFTTNDSHRSKNSFPNSAFWWYYFYCCLLFFSKLYNIYLFILFHYHHLLSWIKYILIQMFLVELTSRTPIIKKLTCLQDHHKRTINMDVVTPDTYLIF